MKNVMKPMALDGIKVLDLSRVLAGPYAAQTLADLGADVIKVENPKGGDDTRRWGPPFMKNQDGTRGDAAYFSACNRNKRSVTIDFSTQKGATLVSQLAARADILIENFRPGGLSKYGLDYHSISGSNPGIIYCSITGFGQEGPYSGRPGYDFLIQGMGGLMSITGFSDGSEGGGPVKVGVAVCDLFTGMFAVNSALAALTFRAKTGKGQHIDCSLLDSQIAMLANQSANWLNAGFCPGRMGNNHPSVAPYTVYKAYDGFLIVACGNDQQFVRLTSALGIAELSRDPKYMTNEARIKNRDCLDRLIGDVISCMKKNIVITKLLEAGVSCGPINSISEVFDDKHVIERGAQVEQITSDGTIVASSAYAAKLSETPAEYRMPPPLLGEHTDEVLQEWIGATKNELSVMRSEGVL